MWVRVRTGIVIGHRLGRGKTARVNLLLIVAAMPGPDVRCTQYRSRPVVARPLVDGFLAVALLVRRAEGVGSHVRCVPHDVMAILVIENRAVVRCMAPVSASHRSGYRSVTMQLISRTQMDLTRGRERLELSWVIAPTGETIMSALHRYHAATARSEHAVAQAIPLSGGMMCVHYSGYSRQGRSEEHTSELQSQSNLVCRLLLEKKKQNIKQV